MELASRGGARADWPFERPLPRPLHALRRALRRLRTTLRPPECAFVYDPGYEQAVPGSPMDALRGEKILRFLNREGLLRPSLMLRPEPLSMRAILRVHAPEYVESLQRPATLERIFGFELDEDAAERALDLHRLMAGGTLLAAREALRTRGMLVNLGGGFHHAAAAEGMGFCVFNDVAVAIAEARARGFERPVLVVDLDVHDGNGTRAIFRDDPSVHVYSLHGEHWGEPQAAAATSLALGHGVADERYLATLTATLPGVAERARPGLVFYLAGSDPAEDDALGDWSISAAGLLARDLMVLELFRRGAARVPLVMLLAGGYGPHAWRHTARSLGLFLSGRMIEPPDNDTIVLERLHSISDSLRARDFAAEGAERPFELREDELFSGEPGLRGERRLLGAFPRYGVELLLERFGLLERLRDRGFGAAVVELVPGAGGTGETLRVHDGARPPRPLIELRLRRSTQAAPGFEVAVIEWLLLQNPRVEFSARRPRLPGQQHPGLGLLRELLGWLAVLCEMLGLDGVVFTPAHFHVARQSRRLVRFVRPEDEARMRACERALDGLSLAEATRAVHEQRLREVATGAAVAWIPCPMALPVSDALRAQLTGADYETQVAEALATLAFHLRAR